MSVPNQNSAQEFDQGSNQDLSSKKPDKINLYGTVPDSIVDGPGLRYSIFVQGCSHACPGCHNPESQPHGVGTDTRISDLLSDIRSNKLCRNVTITGGEPFEQPVECAEIAYQLKSEGYGIWVYTGYLFEDLMASSREGVAELLKCVDVLVDGPFIESQKSLELDWRGSANQRLIDIPATRKAGHIIEWSQPTFDLEPPPSW